MFIGGPPLRKRSTLSPWNLLTVLPPERRRRFLYRRRHHAELNLQNPATLSEKINWRILNDRRPIIAKTCDKLRAKEHVAEMASDVRVPRTLWTGTDARELVDVDLPDRWVLKPNHRSGAVYLGQGRPRREQLKFFTADWLDNFQARVGEWAYSQARPMLFVEEFIGSGNEAPADYKFFVFHGRANHVQVDLSRFSHHQRALYQLPDWTPIDVTAYYERPKTDVPRPAALQEMIDTAVRVADGYDFLRVDLYEVDGAVYFGEMTPYPGSGLEPFDPVSFDRDLGALWTLPADVGA